MTYRRVECSRSPSRTKPPKKCSTESKRSFPVRESGSVRFTVSVRGCCEYAELVGLSSNFTIFDTDDQRGVIKRALTDLNLDSTQYAPAKINAAISRMKNELVTPDIVEAARREQVAMDFKTVVTARVYPEYQKRLRESNAVDFDDLLLHVVSLLQGNPELRSELDHQYRFILVDEYQDTNKAQYEIIRVGS